MTIFRATNGLGLVPIAAAVVLLAGCNGNSVGNTITGTFGQSGMARMIDSSPSTTQTLSLTADGGTIDTGVTGSQPFAPYAKVTAGSITFAAPPTSESETSSIAASTNYSVVLEGESGLVDYKLFGFADTNATPRSTTVRLKIDNAAPDLSTAVDVYVWVSTNSIPNVPFVADLALNQDTGSVNNAPGNAYVPPSSDTTTVFPTGTYDIAIVQTGSVPNGTTDLFDGSVSLSIGNDYSLVIEDSASGAVNDIGVIGGVDEPLQTSNQSSLMLSVSRHPVR
ncbi:MAG TPA: hypothetical protein VEJ20_08060 [Candidatus Eremiobacteraceae bacterium]|nr:hypothetical protein [Candidatus Eremiobacteraceae bacterium]